MIIEKNKEYIVDIIDNGFEGEGIAKFEGFTIFIPNALKGEKIKILIVKVNKNYAYGKIIEILKISDSRKLNIDCTTYKRCGGCNLRHINYIDTLNMKNDIVKNILKKTLNKEIIVNSIIGMENPFFYRNKLQYPVGGINGDTIMGVYANRTHTIIPTQNCYIQDEKSQAVANDVLEYIKSNKIEPYNEVTRSGIIRHVIIKIGKKTGQIMLILVVNKELKKKEELVKWIISKHEITTIVENINNKNTNVILGEKNNILYGNGYIQYFLGKYKFNISPLAFYQVNPIQTEKLYNTAVNLAELNEKDVVYDLYCGIGSISIFLAEHVKKVYGIEIIEDAIRDAKQNVELNNINNANFIAGDVEKLLPELVKTEKPDVVFVDPPRKGLDIITVQNLLKIELQKIVYISCNPATLARDLKLLEEKYDIKAVQPFDMFPFTTHIENIVILKQR